MTADECSELNEVGAVTQALFDEKITRKLGDLVKLSSTPLPKMKEPDWDDEPYEDVLLSKDESTALARVVRWVFGSNGEVIENWNANPILNTLVYKCEFDDGTIKEYVANVIASNIYEEGDAD